MSRPRDLVKGTLGLLILRTLELEPRHGVGHRRSHRADHRAARSR